MALDQTYEKRLFWLLKALYRGQLSITRAPIYVDKSHPVMWFAEKLKRAFPDALFVGIERNPYATIASMIRHEGVSSWHHEWRNYEIPNRFLGISAELAPDYDRLPSARQFAIRWVAHKRRMEDLRGILGDDLLVISYETFARETAEVVEQLNEFVGVEAPIPVPEVRTESLHKWKSFLSDEQCEQIAGIVGFSCEQITA
jgi:hypothetical protein